MFQPTLGGKRVRSVFWRVASSTQAETKLPLKVLGAFNRFRLQHYIAILFLLRTASSSAILEVPFYIEDFPHIYKI